MFRSYVQIVNVDIIPIALMQVKFLDTFIDVCLNVLIILS